VHAEENCDETIGGCTAHRRKRLRRVGRAPGIVA